MKFPKLRQKIRIITQCSIGAVFLGILSLAIGINFQFPQIIFDFMGAVVTGALIQLIISRLIFPFIFGNAFCSQACWDGAFFEIFNSRVRKKSNIEKPRSEMLAWGYLIGLILCAIVVSYWWNPATNGIDLAYKATDRRILSLAENALIIFSGIFLVFLWGSRAYCRRFCPFLTISSLFSKFSIYKITPVNTGLCTKCMACSEICPMLIEVGTYVQSSKRINHKLCILCERCVSSCPKDCLRQLPGNPLQ